jgi:hypothetical protein
MMQFFIWLHWIDVMGEQGAMTSSYVNNQQFSSQKRR